MWITCCTFFGINTNVRNKLNFERNSEIWNRENNRTRILVRKFNFLLFRLICIHHVVFHPACHATHGGAVVWPPWWIGSTVITLQRRVKVYVQALHNQANIICRAGVGWNVILVAPKYSAKRSITEDDSFSYYAIQQQRSINLFFTPMAGCLKPQKPKMLINCREVVPKFVTAPTPARLVILALLHHSQSDGRHHIRFDSFF